MDNLQKHRQVKYTEITLNYEIRFTLKMSAVKTIRTFRCFILIICNDRTRGRGTGLDLITYTMGAQKHSMIWHKTAAIDKTQKKCGQILPEKDTLRYRKIIGRSEVDNQTTTDHWTSQLGTPGFQVRTLPAWYLKVSPWKMHVDTKKKWKSLYTGTLEMHMSCSRHQYTKVPMRKLLPS